MGTSASLPLPSGGTVRPAEHRDVRELSVVLARAFADDPIASFMFRTERRRSGALRRFFAMQLRHMFIDRGEAWTTGDARGAALWAPPSMGRPGWSDMLHMLPLFASLAALGTSVGEAVRLAGAIERGRPRQAHWYLATLGVDPDDQGHGLGSALLQSVLPRLDDMGMPAYLETAKLRNVSFYSRHRFEVIREADPVPGGPHLWFMWREPRPESPVGDADHA